MLKFSDFSIDHNDSKAHALETTTRTIAHKWWETPVLVAATDEPKASPLPKRSDAVAVGGGNNDAQRRPASKDRADGEEEAKKCRPLPPPPIV